MSVKRTTRGPEATAAGALPPQGRTFGIGRTLCDGCQHAGDLVDETLGVAHMTAEHDGTGPESSGEVVLKNNQNFHDRDVREEGEYSPGTMCAGVNLAYALVKLGHAIESERLFAKQMRLGLQIHGLEHCLTKLVKSGLDIAKQ